MTDQRLVQTQSDLLIREEQEDKYLVLNRQSGIAFVASPTAALALDLATQPIGVDGLKEDFYTRFPDIEPETIDQDIDSVVEDMIKVGLLLDVTES